MKKAILFTLAALLVISSLTACGSKKDAEQGEPAYSRVLYDEEDTTTEEESSEEASESDSSSGNEEESKGEKKDEKKKDTDTASSKNSSKSASSKSSSSKSTASKTTSSKKAVSSKAPTNAATASGSNTRSTVSQTTAASSKTTSSTHSSDSNKDTDTNTDTNTDSSTDTDTEWFGSDTDTSTNTDTNTDTDSEIEKGILEESDMSFPINGNQIKVGQNFSEADEILYHFNEEKEVDGGKVYTYNECTITTVYGDDETQETISEILINSPDYKISKEIGIGSTAEDLTRAFGDSDSGYTYVLNGRSIRFTVMNDTVAEIVFS